MMMILVTNIRRLPIVILVMSMILMYTPIGVNAQIMKVSAATEQVSVGSYNDFQVTYVNGTVIKLTVRMIVVNNSVDNPSVELINASHELPLFVNESITQNGILSSSKISSLPGYSDIRHSGWTANSLVQNDSNGLLRVYDTQTGMLLLIDGNTTNEYVFAVCYKTNVLSVTATVITDMIIVGIIIVGSIIVVFIIYVFVIYPRIKRRTIKRKEVRVGSKRKKASEKVKEKKHIL